MWRHIVIEGYCFGEGESGSYPCGRPAVSSFCLAAEMCPYFGHCDSNEREAAYFVAWHEVLWDKLKGAGRNLWWMLPWYIWGRWHTKGLEEWQESLPVVDCPAEGERQKKAGADFPGWYSKAKAESEAKGAR